MQNESVTTGRNLQLPENLDLVAAAALTETLLSMRGSDVSVDGSAVQRIGGQCLQILLSAQVTWNTEGASLEFINLSDEFVKGVELLGVPPQKFANQELF
jgi:chemotaxis protein CheX